MKTTTVAAADVHSPPGHSSTRSSSSSFLLVVAPQTPVRGGPPSTEEASGSLKVMTSLSAAVGTPTGGFLLFNLKLKQEMICCVFTFVSLIVKRLTALPVLAVPCSTRVPPVFTCSHVNRFLVWLVAAAAGLRTEPDVCWRRNLKVSLLKVDQVCSSHLSRLVR